MAENYNEQLPTSTVETTDRGMFDFIKKDDHEEQKPAHIENFATEFDDKVQVSEPKVEEEKHHDTLLEKFHQADDHNSSSSSSDEEDDEDKKRRKKEKKEKKGLKEKLIEKLPGHSADEDIKEPIEKPHVEEVVYSEPSPPIVTSHVEDDHKKGIIEKIKDKLTGEKAVEEPRDVVVEPSVPSVEGEGEEKKGLMDKIKDKIPGLGSKDVEVKKDLA